MSRKQAGTAVLFPCDHTAVLNKKNTVGSQSQAKQKGGSGDSYHLFSSSPLSIIAYAHLSVGMQSWFHVGVCIFSCGMTLSVTQL